VLAAIASGHRFDMLLITGPAFGLFAASGRIEVGIAPTEPGPIPRLIDAWAKVTH
jgi:hypothetical protein